MGTALVHVNADRCPNCAAGTCDTGFTQPALFRHGGYGADRHTVVRHCARFCGWHVTRHVGEQRPARAA